MGVIVTMTASLQCTFGMAPSTLTVIPQGMPVQGGNQMVANIMANIPMANIAPFGMCQSMANPQVASATAAAQGVLTPMPCIPVISAPWAPGSPTVMVNNKPALTQSCKAICNWGGNISITAPGAAMTVQAQG
ncbi:MAG TPA: DUF4280 domain-containing protein [Acidimicrobiales bacterium]